MATLTKEEILATEIPPPELVPTPEWGGDCYIRTLEGDERDAFDQWGNEHASAPEDPDWRGLRANLVGRALCDENGQSMGFTDAEILVLGKKSALALDHCFDVAQRLNGIGTKELEALAKN